MLYETAARAEELLSLNVEDLDPEFRRARVTSKGGATEYVHWATATAQLLHGRTTGPLFLADRRSPTSGPRTTAAADIRPETGRGRLSYVRAEHLFKQATAALDPHSTGWTLHQLRHFVPNYKPNPATSTSAASAATSNSATCIGTVNGDNFDRADPLTPFSVRLQLNPRLRRTGEPA